MKKSLKDRYDELTDIGKKEAREDYKRGKSAEDSISSAKTKDKIALIFGLIVIICVAFSFISKGVANIKSNCSHKKLDFETVSFSSDKEKITVVCSTCKKERPLSHKVTTVVVQEPTCQFEGLQIETYTCIDYPKYVFEKTEKIGKIACDGKTVLSNRVESTCQKQGVEATTKCSMCEQIYYGKPLPLAPHDLEDYGYVAPTCFSTGTTAIKKCNDCDYEEGEPQEIKILPHSIKDTYTVNATYEKGGCVVGMCEGCDYEELLEYNSLPLVSEVFEYELDDDTLTAKLISLKTDSKEIVIPSSINDYKVSEIPSNLFKDNTSVESITINDGVEKISAEAFKNCTSLREVIFPDTLESIGESAFENCKEIRKVVVNTGEIKAKAFANCSNLRIVEVGENVILKNDSFYDCFKIIFFKFPSYYGNGRRKIFDSQGRYGNDHDDIAHYVTLTSGAYSGLDDYYNGETSDEVIKITDGFYYYRYYSYNMLLSIDVPEKNVVIPSYIKRIDGNTFRDMEEELDSILVPMNVDQIGRCNTFYKNLKFYFKGADILGNNYEIGGTVTDPSTGVTTTYKTVRYLYSETYKNDGKLYWYYDENNNVVEY